MAAKNEMAKRAHRLSHQQEQHIKLFPILICSGTTGAPKGVEVTHENIVSGIAALQTYTEHIGIEVKILPTGSRHIKCQ